MWHHFLGGLAKYLVLLRSEVHTAPAHCAPPKPGTQKLVEGSRVIQGCHKNRERMKPGDFFLFFSALASSLAKAGSPP
jgi:hypothetical protein